MLVLSGKNWSGKLFFDTEQLQNHIDNNTLPEKITSSGKVNGYSWLLVISKTIILEISEDIFIEPNDLPLVGYGCNGWLYETQDNLIINNLKYALKVKPCSEGQSLNTKEIKKEIEDIIDSVFIQFHKNNLNYIPAVNSSCSD